MLSVVNDRLVVRANPIGWLTGQNWFGPSDVHWMAEQFCARLEEYGCVQWGRTATKLIAAHKVHLHELAFAKYLPLGQHKTMFANQLKLLLGSVCSHIEGRNSFSVHLYKGDGFIVRTPSVSLTMYDKHTKHAAEAVGWSHPVVDVDAMATVSGSLRVESTVKYSYFSDAQRSLSDWVGVDWCAAETSLFRECVNERFRVAYLMRCPNVFADGLTSSWTGPDRALYDAWLENVPIPARSIARLRRKYGFDASISTQGYVNALWSLLRPTAEQDEEDHRAEVSAANRFPGIKFFAKFDDLPGTLIDGATARVQRKLHDMCAKSGD